MLRMYFPQDFPVICVLIAISSALESLLEIGHVNQN